MALVLGGLLYSGRISLLSCAHGVDGGTYPCPFFWRPEAGILATSVLVYSTFFLFVCFVKPVNDAIISLRE